MVSKQKWPGQTQEGRVRRAGREMVLEGPLRLFPDHVGWGSLCLSAKGPLALLCRRQKAVIALIMWVETDQWNNREGGSRLELQLFKKFRQRGEKKAVGEGSRRVKAGKSFLGSLEIKFIIQKHVCVFCDSFQGNPPPSTLCTFCIGYNLTRFMWIVYFTYIHIPMLFAFTTTLFSYQPSWLQEEFATHRRKRPFQGWDGKYLTSDSSGKL